VLHVCAVVVCGFAGSMDGGSLPLQDKRRQQHRANCLWRIELEKVTLYILKRVHCPCCRCKGQVQCSLAKVKDHLTLEEIRLSMTMFITLKPVVEDHNDHYIFSFYGQVVMDIQLLWT